MGPVLAVSVRFVKEQFLKEVENPFKEGLGYNRSMSNDGFRMS
jgi:hypothetical protein